MEIEITDFLKDECPRDYSASVAEIGANAGSATWQAATDNSDPLRFMTSPERICAFKAFVLDSGGWDETECEAFTVTELEALFIQWVSGDLREMFFDSFANPIDFSALTDEQWCEAERLASDGTVSGRVFRGDDGRVYFYCGS
jgi:hypothetical protein